MNPLLNKLASLSPEKRALVLKKLRQQQKQNGETEKNHGHIIQKRRDNAIIPLSQSQKRLWFLSKLDASESAYHIPSVVKLTGKINLNILQQAFNQLTQRHEILRAKIVDDDNGKPSQQIQKFQNTALSIIDLRCDDVENPSNLDQIIQQTINQPFILSECLYRIALIRLPQAKEEACMLIFVIHHIIADGWSMGILVKDFGQSYQSLIQNQDAMLPPLKVQYADYACWQYQQEKSKHHKAMAFWQAHLANAPVKLELATDYPRPPVQTFEGKTIPFEISPRCYGAILSLTKQHQCTLFIFLFTVWSVFLSRSSRQHQVVVGTPVANRLNEQQESMVGLFVNTLALHSDFGENPDFITALNTTKQYVMEAFQYQSLAFDQLIEQLGIERNLSISPLFQTMFVLQNVPLEMVVSADLKIQPLTVNSNQAKFDLTVFFEEIKLEGVEAQLTGALEYNTALFSAETAAYMIQHLIALLDDIVLHPAKSVLSFNMISDHERQQLLYRMNQTQAEYPADKCFPHLFQLQTLKTPAAIAVEDTTQSLNYQQLNERADQLAISLQQQGVKQGQCVAVYLQRSVHLLTTLLGIMKMGGVYVPIDPAYPDERIRYMLTDSQAKLLISESRLAEQAAQLHETMLLIDQEPDTAHGAKKCPQAVDIQPGDPVYVIYTSGSTGQPKGVMIKHQGLVNYLCWAIDYYHVIDGIGTPVHSSIAFDATITSLFTPLLVGKKVVMLPEQGEIEALAAIIQSQNNLSLIKITPAHLDMLSKMVDPEKIRNKVRVFVIGGEALSHQTLSFWQKYSPESRYINEYGPTETVVGCCIYDAPNQVAVTQDVAIGQAIANTRLYILDTQMQPVPIGVIGELYIGGDGVALGYMNKADMTQARFLDDPFTHQGKIYKTGDLARYRYDGMIEYAGRCDDQVKLRGYRIELGEIEAQLQHFSTVSEAVVMIRADALGTKRLFGYVVTQVDRFEKAALIQHCQQSLPEYMVPYDIVILDKMPLTANGKVNKQALPEPEVGLMRADFEPPQTEMECLFAKIWAAVLGIEKVGRQDNFFSLGGDSIISIQIISSARQANVAISVQDIFKNQTLAALSLQARPLDCYQIDQADVVGLIPQTPIMQHFFKLSQAETCHHYNQSVILELNPTLDLTSIKQAVMAVFKHHDMLKLQVVQHASGWQCHLPEHGLIGFEYQSGDEEKSEAALERYANQLQLRLNLFDGPVCQIGLITHHDMTTRYLVMVIHHLVVDGVSWSILLEDLAVVCDQLSRRQPIQLPAKTTSFKDWAQRLVKLTNSDKVLQATAFWRQQLISFQSLPVKAHFNVADNMVLNETQVHVVWSENSTGDSLKTANNTYRTNVQDLILVALVQSLQHWLMRADYQIDVESHGRDHDFEGMDISRTVGWFTEIYPLMLTYHSQMDTLIKAIKEQVRRCKSFGRFFGLLSTTADAPLGQLPRSEICLNYLGDIDQSLASNTFTLSEQSAGADQSPKMQRDYLIVINCYIHQQQLKMDWRFCDRALDELTIRQVANQCLQNLTLIVNHCVQVSQQGSKQVFTPSDFPLANLNQQALDYYQQTYTALENIYPLAPLQSGFLFHHLYNRHNSAYFQQLCFVMRGELNVVHYQQAWYQVVKQFAVLRTVFVIKEGTIPLQIVLSTLKPDFRVIDFSQSDPGAQQALIAEFLKKDQQQPFDLEKGPLLRFILIKLSAQQYQFIWSYHHILLDGWSVPIVLQYLIRVYQRLSGGGVALAGGSNGYDHYLQWLQQQQPETAQTYWRQYLAGFTSPLPTVMALAQRNDKATFYDEQSSYLSTELTKSIDAFVKAQHLTVNTLLQCAWAFVLGRYSNTDDVVFGMTVSGRPPEVTGISEMVGLFINTLPCRIQLASDLSIKTWLKKVHLQQVESERFSHYPLADIQKQWQLGHGALFNHLFVFENYPVEDLTQTINDHCTISNARTIEHTSYPVTFMVSPGAQIYLKCTYDSQCIDADKVTRLFDHMQVVLAGLIKHPEQPLTMLKMLAEAEYELAVQQWNQTDRTFPDISGVHVLFEQQVLKTPEKIAVIAGDQHINYQTLNAKANQWARWLRQQGVAEQHYVGVCLTRSIDLVIAMLAVLKAGAAYVPMDPEYPDERLVMMVKQAKLALVLTQEAGLWQPEDQSLRMITLASLKSQIQPFEATNLNLSVAENQCCYAIFTSGSTGIPKCAGVYHRNFVNLLQWFIDEFNLSANDKVLLISSPSFDLTQKNIYAPLLIGGQLHLYAQSHYDPVAINDEIQQQQISWLNCTPSAFYPLLRQSHEFAHLQSLRWLFLGGEPINMNHLAQWLKAATDHCSVVNTYGPTECADISASYIIKKSDIDQQSVPIGQSIANVKQYILDAQGQPVPVGVVGELCIAGAGVGCGYLNDTRHTAEKFIPNPFVENGRASMLYKTGDLARYQMNGQIEYVGRSDHQIKFNGFRIDPGEIESQLKQHQDIQDSLVLLQTDEAQSRLLAYIVSDHLQLNVMTVNQFLKKHLPVYMIPSQIMILSTFPLTPNGKIDRHALPEFNQPSGRLIVQPRNDHEMQLKQIWDDVLHRSVGMNDDFFIMGGHSLTAIQLVMKIQDEMNFQIPVSVLFEHPTIEQFALKLNEVSIEYTEKSLLTIRKTGSHPPLFCVGGAGGVVMYLNALAQHLGKEQPFYVLQASGIDGRTAVDQTIEAMAARYIEAIQEVHPHGPYYLCGHSIGGKVIYEMAQQLQSLHETVAMLAILDTGAPMLDDQVHQKAQYSDAQWMMEIITVIEDFSAQALSITHGQLVELSLDAQINDVHQALINVGFFPPKSSSNNMRGFFNVYKANILCQYKPKTTQPVPISLFRSRQHDDAEKEVSPALLLQREDPAFGWQPYADGEVNIHWVSGSHRTMLAEPHVKTLAGQLNAEITQIAKTHHTKPLLLEE